MAPKVREVTRRLQAEGWILTRTTGSQRIFTHPTKPAVVVVAGKPSKQSREGIWTAIQRQAGWRR